MNLLKILKKERKRTSLMDPFNLPFSLMGKLPQEILSDYERIRILEGKKEAARGVIDELNGISDGICAIPEEERSGELDMYTCLLLERGIIHMEAELAWLDTAIEEIRSRMNKNDHLNNNDH